MASVTGLGGVFYKVPDVERTRACYRDNLGLGGEWGIMLDGGGEDPLSLRVDDLAAMVAGLESKGIEILGRQDDDYGKFAWLLDCDGVKLELWEQKVQPPEG